MTIEEFNKQGWTGGMSCKYKGNIYPIRSVCFDEKLVAIQGMYGDINPSEDITWVRCENIYLIRLPESLTK